MIDRLNRSSYFVIVSFLFMLLLFSATLSPVLGSQSVNIFPPGSKPYGLTFAEHQKNFWKWVLEIPANESPVNDLQERNVRMVSQIQIRRFFT